ncbi:FGGY-family carbohydrate kinase [Wenjunlia vitaminophila]|uniref:FGGY-family carbohydrate kinase n=1 Tax=Wenjunlia vitaminophila TaxID=76728 RepID=UPI000B191BFB|nr:FGGY family carbohydrate kinase [Wenjunlia vitaminophila]
MILAGLDVGSTHCKAVLATPGGTVLAHAQCRTPADGPTHDVGALCAAALDALAECVTAVGRQPDAVGITGMAETGAPLDAAGEPLLPASSWSDPRPRAHAERLRRDLGAGDLHAATGVLPSPKVPLAKWLWMREEHPAALDRMRTWAGAADLVAQALTGQVGTDATFAQRSMAWDVHAGRWHRDLLGLAGLDADRMPAVRGPGEPVGRCRRTGVPVVVAGHDHLVGAWAAGVRGAGEVADSMGTAEAVVTVGETAPDAPAAGRQGMSYGRHVDGTHWCVLAGMSSSGALVEWFCDQVLGLAGAPAEQRYRRFAELVERAGAGPTGLTVQPYLSGRSAPDPDPARRLTVHGLDVGHGLPHLARALLEGAAHQAHWMAEVQGELTGNGTRGVTLLGGSVRQRTWVEIKAALAPWPTRVCAVPDAACLGAAAWAGAALGLDPAAVLLPGHRVSPPAELAAAYRSAHRAAFLPAVTARPAATRPESTPRAVTEQVRRVGGRGG